MQSIQTNIDTIHCELKSACLDAGRSEQEICLLAVSKTRSVAEIRTAAAAGLTHLGENYLQDAVEKIEALQSLGLTWHFIGAIQSNKTRLIATHFDWVHTLDRMKIALRLNQHCHELNRRLNICIQVNIDREPQKAGVFPEQLADLCTRLKELKNLELRGLMAIPKPADTFEHQREQFLKVAGLFEQISETNPHLNNWDTLSMGMSGDYRAAILSGATIIRIGTAIFGPRPV